MCRSEDLVDKSLAFELVVLEWTLATASKLLCEEVLAFEHKSQPVIENIAKKVHQAAPYPRMLTTGLMVPSSPTCTDVPSKL